MDSSAPHNDLPTRERGSSGIGTLLGVGGFIAAGLAGAAFFEFAPLAIIAGGALAVMGASFMVLQNHKEKRNDTHALRAYNLTKGYHHEPEVAKDQSLIHLIKGASDLPERQQYIRDHYNITPKTPNAYRTERAGGTALIGLAVGALVTGVIATFAAPFMVGSALAYGLMLGALAGTTAAGVHSAKVMQHYGQYLDGIAASEEQKAKSQPKQQPPVEYDNQRTRPGSYAVDVTAARGRTTTTVSRS